MQRNGSLRRQYGVAVDALLLAQAGAIARQEVRGWDLGLDPDDLAAVALERLARQTADIENPGGWLRRTIQRLVIDEWRRQQRQPQLQDPQDLSAVAGPDLIEEALGDHSVQAVLAVLQGRSRTVFVLRGLQQVPAAEVAQLLGMTPAAVHQAHRRARRELSEALAHRPALREALRAA